ncbi:MAG: helix-turn-helix transcriptional regulator [Phycisphaerae bacterium]|nr:helix-turn-helix transcriptional regulator [Phycisphaerae bacterium]
MINELHIRLLYGSWTTIDSSWNNYELYSSFWRLYINKYDGAQLIRPDHPPFPIKKNTIYFIPPWLRILSQTSQPTPHFYIHFDIVNLTPQIIQKLFPNPILIRSNVNFANLIKHIDAQHNQPTTSSTSLCRIKALLYDSLAELIRQLPPSSRNILDQTLSTQRRFAPCLQYIQDHLSDNLSNSHLAKRCHMSINHFVHAFKKNIGQSPAQYVLHQRIARCAQLLILTDNTIDQIAESMGFANRFHFSRHFKKIMNIAPAAYRKTIRT